MILNKYGEKRLELLLSGKVIAFMHELAACVDFCLPVWRKMEETKTSNEYQNSDDGDITAE